MASTYWTRSIHGIVDASSIPQIIFPSSIGYFHVSRHHSPCLLSQGQVPRSQRFSKVAFAVSRPLPERRELFMLGPQAPNRFL